MASQQTHSTNPSTFAPEEYDRRHARVRAAMRELELDAVIAYANTRVKGPVRYLTNYAVRFTAAQIDRDGVYTQGGSSAALIAHDGDVVLRTDLGWDVGRARTCAAVRDVDFATDFGEAFGTAIAEAGFRRVGIDNWHIFPAHHYLTLRERAPATDFVPTRVIEDTYKIKSPAEIELLRGAATCAAKAADEGLDAVRVGGTDFDVGLATSAAALRYGDLESAGAHCVGAGPDTELGISLPNAVTQRTIARGEWVVIDLNTQYGGYAGDIARMRVAGSVADLAPELKRLYDVTLEMNERAIEAVRPGVRPIDLLALVHDVARSRGIDPGERDLLGHGLGLDMHDPPDFFYDTEPLDEGMTITLEPNLGIAGVAGTRVEDTILVTADGCEVLTADSPKTLRGSED
jgi:Xaa-Pro aminopeptidase